MRDLGDWFTTSTIFFWGVCFIIPFTHSKQDTVEKNKSFEMEFIMLKCGSTDLFYTLVVSTLYMLIHIDINKLCISL